MASVQYVHTQRFQAEVVAFIQHFTQLQDVLGRQRAAIKGQTVSTVWCLVIVSMETFALCIDQCIDQNENPETMCTLQVHSGNNSP